MNDKPFSVLAMLTLCALMGASMATGAQTLVSLYHMARHQDRQFLAAQASLDAMREKPLQARAGLLPTVNLTANQTGQNGQTASKCAVLGMDAATHPTAAALGKLDRT